MTLLTFRPDRLMGVCPFYPSAGAVPIVMVQTVRQLLGPLLGIHIFPGIGPFAQG